MAVLMTNASLLWQHLGMNFTQKRGILPASYPGAPLFYRDQWQLINAKRAKVLGQHAKKPSAQGC